MQRTVQLNWLGKLAALAVLTSSLAWAATIDINAGAGPKVEISYDCGTDGYYLNNSNTAFISGIANGLTSGSNYERDVDGSTAYIARTGGSATTATLVWTFNFADTIKALTVQNTTMSWTDATNCPTYIYWSVSTDGGTNWPTYQTLTAGNNAGAFATNGGTVIDLSSYLVAGETSVMLKSVMTASTWTNRTAAQIFRTNAGPTWGLDVNATVPEPASLGLLTLGGLFVLRRRRN